MGAMTAILLLIFKDTILGFVEYSNVCIWYGACGDWIAIKYDADGQCQSI
jgi:hypothetical protein